MESEKYISKTVKVKIDRPLASKHPKHDLVYELNYWFIPDTISWDSEELDAYVLWVDEPLSDFEWVCIAVLRRLDDDDDKLIIAPKWVDFTDDEIMNKVNFQEKYFKSIILR